MGIRPMLLLAGASIVGTGFAWGLQHPAQVPDSQQVAAAGEMFKGQCAGCHVPPDLRFKADQVWLGQIKGTA